MCKPPWSPAPSACPVRPVVEHSSPDTSLPPRRGFNYPAQLRCMTRSAPECVPPAPGYVVDHTRARVGSGAADFEAVKALLQRWGCVQPCASCMVLLRPACPRGGLTRHPLRCAKALSAGLGVSGAEDEHHAREQRCVRPCVRNALRPRCSDTDVVAVCVCARTLVLWSRNPLQVVYADQGASRASRKRFAYAHGTLHGHMLVRDNAQPATMNPSCCA